MPPRRPAPLLAALALCAATLVPASAADDGRAMPQAATRFMHALPEARTRLFRDIDRDGVPELLTERGVFAWSAVESRWIAADYALPAGFTLTDAQGRDAGLRFADLNGDGTEDLLQSNADGFRVHLWAGTVKTHLGWKRGWPHVVAHGPAAPDADADAARAKLPPFVREGRDLGATFSDTAITWPTDPAAERAALRRTFAALIAFDRPEPKSPADALATMRLREGFTIELVAAEPLVAGPVAFDWDAQGRLWVVEMPDYPMGLDGRGAPGGALKLLTDTDGDGRLDRATVAVDRLPFPTGLAPWRDGVILAASADMIFVSDFGPVGRARQRRTLFTGFREGNQQHRQNGYEWGLDGWFHGANGDSGGTINGVSISGRDFRFRPATGEFEAESGQTQFGRHRDDWGNWFGNNNPQWLWHYTIEERYLRRNPRAAVRSARRMLAQYPDATRVFPSSKAPIRFNQPQSLGHVTSACSATPYRDALFGADFAASVFICEPVHNLVHREVLAPDGASFTSRRAPGEETREFLASTDPWFRPVFLKTGPDGALYIADFYRFALEHPEWIPPETLARLDVRAGAERGRIYRVFPTGAKLPPIPNLAALTDDALAAALDSPNGWQRDTAQRVLTERAARGTAPRLRQLARTAAEPKVRLQALATLDTLGVTDAATVITALRDPHPGVRRHALRVSETLASSAETLEAVLALAGDPDAAVRLQRAFSLGAFRDPRARAALADLAAQARDDELLRVAVLSSLPPGDPLEKQFASPPPAAKAAPRFAPPKPTTTNRAAVIARYAGAADLAGDAARGRARFAESCAICHRLKNEGTEVGPDLGMTADKPLDWLLAAILDPSAAVEERYRAHVLTLTSGAQLAGIVSAETTNNLVLRLPGGAEVPVLRADIAKRETSKVSLMPEGLESALTPQDVADLVAWLRAP